MRNRLMPLLAGFFLLITTTHAIAAELVVVASTAPEFKAGWIVTAGSSLDVPAGQAVTLISQSGKVVTITGPHSGPVSESESGGASSNSLIASLSGLLGGGGTEADSLGVMRAAMKPAEPDDPWVVVVSRSGDHCVPADAQPILWRSRKNSRGALTLKKISGGGKKSVTVWPAGAGSLAWPTDITVTDGAAYFARLKGAGAAARLVIHQVPDGLATDSHRAAWMADQGCRSQAIRLLAQIR